MLCTGAATARDNRCGMHLQSPVVHVQAVGNFPSEPEVAHFESCANSCADHDTPESAHEDDPGADDDTHESKHDDDSCPMDPAPVMAEPVPHFAEDFQDFQQ